MLPPSNLLKKPIDNLNLSCYDERRCTDSNTQLLIVRVDIALIGVCSGQRTCVSISVDNGESANQPTPKPTQGNIRAKPGLGQI